MSIHSKTTGSGPELLLIHGWGLHGGIFSPLVDSLADRFRATTVDLPGHGRSPRPGALTLERAAEAVAAVAAPGAIWLGWSLGGMVALTAAANGVPMRRLVLVAANARFVADRAWAGVEPTLLEGFAAELARDYRATLNRFIALQARGSERAREELRALRAELFTHGEPDRRALAEGLTILQDADLRAQLIKVSMPALIVQGASDTLVPNTAAKAMAERLPQGRLAQVPGAGHAPFLSHPEAFEKELLEFLQ